MTAMSGDPAGMRAAAAQLRVRAEEVSRSAAQADSGVTSMSFAGPAADRWRAAVAQHAADLHATAARMEAVADTLTRYAAIVEQEQLQQAMQGRA